MDKYIETPLTKEKVKDLHAGDYVYITGTIYTARDAAHKRMTEELSEGKSLPFDTENQIVYYLGPTPNREGQVIGSAGPTTSSRMDKYAPVLMDRGITGMIGKGEKNTYAAYQGDCKDIVRRGLRLPDRYDLFRKGCRA